MAFHQSGKSYGEAAMTAADRSSRRGFVLLMALGVFALVAVTIVALAAATSTTGHRTSAEFRLAQLDELLVAALMDARGHLAASPPAANDSWSMALPPTLTEQQANVKLTITAANADESTLVIHVTLADAAADQTAQFKRVGTRWQFASVQTN
jgi:hypothetical protein